MQIILFKCDQAFCVSVSSIKLLITRKHSEGESDSLIFDRIISMSTIDGSARERRSCPTVPILNKQPLLDHLENQSLIDHDILRQVIL